MSSHLASSFMAGYVSENIIRKFELISGFTLASQRRMRETEREAERERERERERETEKERETEHTEIVLSL